jgi:glycyl-tRNA synthetase beta chain
MDVVRRGYERVVRARLEDAEFYWRQDLKIPIDKMAGRLKEVVYHPRLGTSWEKVERFRGLAGWLGDILFPGDGPMRGRVDEAARLCKADLTSGMVGEFPELQGVMGERYAERVGFDPTVSRAIFEHYLPRGERDAPPAGDAGALVGLADRMDTLAGMIGLGYLPSGSEDPFALRRAANAIIRILLDKGYRLSLAGFAEKALAPLYPKFKERNEVVHKNLLNFLRNRLSAYFSRGEESADLVEAILSAQGGLGWEDPVHARARLIALSRFDENPETFEPATTTFSRVTNIIRQAGGASERDYSEALIADEAERALTDAYRLISPVVLDILDSHKDEPRSEPGVLEANFAKYIEKMMDLRPVVDAFFDKVLVMEEDEKIRRHRLGLLAKVAALFAPVADFAKIRSRRQSD